MIRRGSGLDQEWCTTHQFAPKCSLVPLSIQTLDLKITCTTRGSTCALSAAKCDLRGEVWGTAENLHVGGTHMSLVSPTSGYAKKLIWEQTLSGL